MADLSVKFTGEIIFFILEEFYGTICPGENVWENVCISMWHYKCVCVVVMIRDTLVNTHTQTDRRTAFDRLMLNQLS